MSSPPAGDLLRGAAEHALRANAHDRRQLQATLERVVSWRHCAGRGDYQRLEPFFWERRGDGLRSPLLDGRGNGEEYGFDAEGQLVIRREAGADAEVFEFAPGSLVWIRYSPSAHEISEVAHLEVEEGRLLGMARLSRGPGDPHRIFEVEDYTYVDGRLESIRSWITTERADGSKDTTESTWAVERAADGTDAVRAIESSAEVVSTADDPDGCDGGLTGRPDRQAIALSSGKAVLVRLCREHGCEPDQLGVGSAQRAFDAFGEFLRHPFEDTDAQHEEIMLTVSSGSEWVSATLARLVSFYGDDGEYEGRRGFSIEIVFPAAEIKGAPSAAIFAGGRGSATWARDVRTDPAYAAVFEADCVPQRVVVSDVE